MKKIKPHENFDLNGVVYKYSVGEGGNITLIKITNASKAFKPDFQPPTLADVKEWFKKEGYSEEGAIKAYEYYTKDGANWHDRNGNKVLNWKQKMRVNWLRPEFKLNDSSAPSGMVM